MTYLKENGIKRYIKTFKYFIFIFLIGLNLSCKSNHSIDSNDSSIFPLPLRTSTDVSNAEIYIWKLSWRFFFNSITGNKILAKKQFDTLIINNAILDSKLLIHGLKLYKNEYEIQNIISSLDRINYEEICNDDYVSSYNFKFCKNFVNKVALKDSFLLKELAIMYIEDQYSRDNSQDDLIKKYNFDYKDVDTNSSSIQIDKKNLIKLKKIISENGVLSKNEVGELGMRSIFIITQHSDEDVEWQKKMLNYIKNSVLNKDLEPHYFASLYDRIKRNQGQKQLFGTQFRRVDLQEKVAEILPVNDSLNLTARRIQYNLPPLDYYKSMALGEWTK